eukprot:comp23983_c0_seq1/m.42578 comp23983_c0_seq1/g.42578  ORF comp23983_c0_seq1/g.42578 comp23983_c0_seq1/m.42578 type:complete len:751 (-) comp23983_c0_seq1:39-2291(-)
MAAVDFHMGDDYEDEEPSMEEMSIDDSLGPLDKLTRYVKSDLMLHRLFVVKDITDTVETVGVAESIKHVLPVMIELRDDPEPLIRNSLIEQLPKITQYFLEHGGEEGYYHVKTSLFGFIIHFLTDEMEPVRGLAQKCMLPMMQLIREGDREDAVCPALDKLANEDLEEEYRMEALNIMAEAAPLLGRTLCIKFVVPLLVNLAKDRMFRVRKICATSFGSICEVVGKEATVSMLLETYFALCVDEIWGVRKGCVESFIKLSENVTRGIRATKLTHLFCQMADDPSRWVRSEAFKNLGRFIYTFTLPDDDATTTQRASVSIDDTQEDELSDKMSQLLIGTKSDETQENGDENKRSEVEAPRKEGGEERKEVGKGAGGEGVATAAAEGGVVGSEGGAMQIGGEREQTDTQGEETQSTDTPSNESQGTMTAGGGGQGPDVLLKLYRMMADPQSAKNIDVEIVYHCAYCLPGVLLALGPEGWEHVRDIYHTLANDLQWKVRRTLAHSIHEVAQILGTDRAEAELVPVFNSFLKDLDEVKVGAIKHFAYFLAVLPASTRAQYLQQLPQIRTIENANNWRFRALLAQQLTALCTLYPPELVADSLSAVALGLALDEVANVREHAHHSLGVMLQTLKDSGRTELTEQFIRTILDNFPTDSTSHARQIFIRLCHYLARSCDTATFEAHFLPPLLALASDPIPNVRISLGRMLAELAMLDTYKHNEHVQAAITQLEADAVPDVRQGAAGAIPPSLYLSVD